MVQASACGSVHFVREETMVDGADLYNCLGFESTYYNSITIV